MTVKLWIIGGFALLLSALWLISTRLTPHRGFLRFMERVCIGIVLCYCLALLARPFGLEITQGPLSAVLAGTLGLPGAALSFWVGGGM